MVDGQDTMSGVPMRGYEHLVSGEDGYLPELELPEGTYWLHEETVPAGYHILLNDIRLVVTDARDGNSTPVVAAAKTTVSKTDENNVNVSEADGVYQVTVENTPILVKLRKQDQEKNLKLSGAEFQMYTLEAYQAGLSPMTKNELYDTAHAADAAPSVWVSDSSGNFYVGMLKPGTYVLVETKAPAGYNMLAAPIELVITNNDAEGYNMKSREYGSAAGYSRKKMDNNGYYNLYINNTPGVELPSTGGPGTAGFAAAGLILMLLGAGLWLLRRTREQNEAVFSSPRLTKR